MHSIPCTTVTKDQCNCCLLIEIEPSHWNASVNKLELLPPSPIFWKCCMWSWMSLFIVNYEFVTNGLVNVDKLERKRLFITPHMSFHHSKTARFRIKPINQLLGNLPDSYCTARATLAKSLVWLILIRPTFKRPLTATAAFDSSLVWVKDQNSATEL